MNVLNEAAPQGQTNQPVCLALGVFDGVHRGHAAVLQHLLEDARNHQSAGIAVTFHPHPETIVAPAHAPSLLYPLWRRLNALQSLGVPTTLVFPFDLSFSRQPADVFIERLVHGFGRVASITVGAGFVFGHRRSGNLDRLRLLGKHHGFVVHSIQPLLDDASPISSSRLRDLVATGAFVTASHLLGRPYTLAGVVQSGQGLGRQWGVPTANLDVSGLVLPPLGVYAGRAHLPDGRSFPAALNLGSRPTVAQGLPEIRAETHLLDFQGDLYGLPVEFEPLHFLRPEQRFPSPEALLCQIHRDLELTRRLLGNHPS